MRTTQTSSRDTRNATNESVHRTMNEAHEKDSGSLASTMRCECECHRAECGNSFRITIADYEAVRAEARRFVVTPGHESDEESVVLVTETYLVIEKVGEQGLIAESLDPR
jgi:hypothetical protein